ncbi:MAG: ABC transporter ATP-binding protein, partial [Alphaproteobacteria bacterium]
MPSQPQPAQSQPAQSQPVQAPRSATISVRRLTKRFDSVVAVDAVSFDVAAGTTVALLGGNGAGKTTTLSMLIGLLLPSEGEIRVLGEDMVRHRFRVLGRMNFSSPYVDLPNRLTARQNLMVYGKLYGVRNLRARIAELGADLDLGKIMDRPTGALSSGQKTRI